MMEFVKAIHCPVARENGTNSFIPTYKGLRMFWLHFLLLHFSYGLELFEIHQW